MPSKIAGLTAQNYERYRQVSLKRESGGTYSTPPNAQGFAGGYGIGAAAAETAGYLKPGSTANARSLSDPYGNSAMLNSNNWVGGSKPSSLQSFLANPAAQDDAFRKINTNIYRTYQTKTDSKGNYIINENTPQEQIAGELAAGNLMGATGRLNKGLDSASDANGFNGRNAYNQMAYSVANPDATIPGNKSSITRNGAPKTAVAVTDVNPNTKKTSSGGQVPAEQSLRPGEEIVKGSNPNTPPSSTVPASESLGPRETIVGKVPIAESLAPGETIVGTVPAEQSLAPGETIVGTVPAAESLRPNETIIESSKKPPPVVDRGSDISDSQVSNLQNSITVSSTPSLEGLGEDIALPVVNPLEKFVSYNYLFTFSSLSNEQVNFPETSYRMGGAGIGKIILSSGGRFSENRVSTAYVTDDNPAGKYDYFIDEVVLNHLLAPTNEAKATTVTNFSFEVTEPYSLGQFLQSCQIAARENDHQDYTLAPYLLTVEFKGYDEENTPTSVATRYFPLNVYSINMTVTAAGSKYQIQAQAWNEIALNDTFNLLKTDFAVSGDTVVEMLQKGERSLTQVVNSKLLALTTVDSKKDAGWKADEIAIIFPDVTTTVNESSQENDKGAMSGSAVGGDAVASTKLSLFRSAKTKVFVQGDGEISALGTASFNFDGSRGGLTPKLPDNPNSGNQDIKVEALSNKTFPRNVFQIDTTAREFVFRKGTSIINAITEIMLMSEYCTGAITGNPGNGGYYDWFKIETQVYLEKSLPQNKNVNRTPKLLVYRVMPYKIHKSKFMTPNENPGYEALKATVVKEYNYIYTGKNVDVLEFKLNLTNNFGIPWLADGLGDANADALTASLGQSSAVPNEMATYPIVAEAPKEGGLGDSGTGYATTRYDHEAPKNSDGAGEADNYATRVARQFQSRILNFDTEKVVADLVILGDPYYLADSGIGNFTNTNSSKKINLTSTSSIDYQSGEVDILFNFFTPVDIDSSGSYIFPNDISARLNVNFSGLYQVITSTSTFSKGKFTQTLALIRRPNQNTIGDEGFDAISQADADVGAAMRENEERARGASEQTANNAGPTTVDINLSPQDRESPIITDGPDTTTYFA